MKPTVAYALCITDKRRSELTDGERDHQHEGEGDQVLHIIDGERKLRWHEEKIKQRHTQERGNDGG